MCHRWTQEVAILFLAFFAPRCNSWDTVTGLKHSVFRTYWQPKKAPQNHQLWIWSWTPLRLDSTAVKNILAVVSLSVRQFHSQVFFFGKKAITRSWQKSLAMFSKLLKRLIAFWSWRGRVDRKLLQKTLDGGDWRRRRLKTSPWHRDWRPLGIELRAVCPRPTAQRLGTGRLYLPN